MNKETVLMRRIEVALSNHGCFVLRTNSGVYYTPQGMRVTIGFPGLADIIGCTQEGRFFAIEVKMPGEKPRQNQMDFLDAMKKNGALAGWATTVQEAIDIVDGNEEKHIQLDLL